MHGLHDSNDTQFYKLDPTVGRIYRKLLYLMVISIITTLLLVCSVLAVVIYKTTRSVASYATDVSSVKTSDPIIVPSGAHLVSQSLSNNLISLEILKPDNSTELIIYDHSEGRIIKTLQIARDIPIFHTKENEKKQ